METNLIPLSDTETARVGRFVASRYANLVRDTVSGMFHCRAKVGGKLVRKSLRTKSIEAAKRRLDALLEDERARVNPQAAAVDDWRFAALARVWVQRLEADKTMKPRAVEYRKETLAMIQKSWTGFDALKPAAVSVGMCRLWADQMAAKYSASRYNGCVETLRGLFKLALDFGLVSMNPAMQVERKAATRKVKHLPTVAEFRSLLARFDGMPARRRGAWLVRFLAFSGARPAAAAMVMPRDVDLERNELSLPPIKHQAARLVVPMSKDLRAVVVELLDEHPGGEKPLLPVRSPRKALATACRELGLPRLTPYDLRHLFTTHLLEAGVAPPLVAALRGDKDGGAMLLKHYFHARQEALRKAVRKVRF